MTVNRRTTLWVAAALLGIAATATVAWSASQLAATNVGLAGDPLSVTSGLAPAGTSVPAHPDKAGANPHRPARRRPPHANTTSSAANAPTPLPVTPSPPIPHAPVVAAPANSATSATTTTAASPPAPTHRRSARHRDDSGGDGSGNPHHGPDD